MAPVLCRFAATGGGWPRPVERGVTMLISLETVVLVPAVELEPFAFAAPDRTHPASTGPDSPEAWGRYWLDSLADAGVVGLTPLRPGSWHVPVAAFTTPVVLGRYLDAVVR